jgi:NADPH-dependent 2,4-dienoyl-CoA reductase/sulfur reductase-like enzyme
MPAERTEPSAKVRAGAPVEVTVDVAVVGGGPAGVAAAVTAARSGAQVALLDAGPRLGGQYYRRPPVDDDRPTPPNDRRVRRSCTCSRGIAAGSSHSAETSHSAERFDRLEAQLPGLTAAGRLRVLDGTTVWSAQGSAGAFRLRVRGGDREPDAPLAEVTARAVVVATGAHDRQLPFPGWDLPGVMSAGAAQALVKGSGVVPGRRVVVAGTGPFLLAVAATLLRAGAEVVAVVEAGTPHRLLARPHDVLPAWSKAVELAGFVRLLVRHRVPYLAGHRVLRATGDGAAGQGVVRSVTVARSDPAGRPRPGSARELACDVLAVGFGFTAHTDLLLQLGCPAARSADGGLAVTVDRVQRTGVAGVLAAGETTGVGGADLALTEGLVAGAAAAGGLGFTPAVSARQLRRWHTRISGLRRFAAALHRTFAVPPGWQARLDDDTVVCRCEEVTAGGIRSAVQELGATDPRTVKLLSRAGMGWCQGRICGFAVDRLCPPAADDTAAAQRLVAGSARPLAVPVTLGALAALMPDHPAEPRTTDPQETPTTGTQEEPPR